MYNYNLSAPFLFLDKPSNPNLTSPRPDPTRPGNCYNHPFHPLSQQTQKPVMLRGTTNTKLTRLTRNYSRIATPPPNCTPKSHTVVRVCPKTNVAQLGPPPKNEHKPRQLLSLPPFPCYHPLLSPRVTAISWMKFYFQDIDSLLIHSHFKKGLVSFDFSTL